LGGTKKAIEHCKNTILTSDIIHLKETSISSMMGKIFYGMMVVRLIPVNYQEKVVVGVNILVKFTTGVRFKTYT
jgi:hypothetical protein